MGTKNRALVLSKEERIFADIQQALINIDTVSACDWKETMIAGLAAIRQAKPDIIFLDEELCYPDVSTAVKEFTVKMPEIRIILLAQMGKRDKIDAAVLAGAAGYLLKPLDSSEVVAMAKRVLENYTSDPAAQPTNEKSATKMGKIITLFSTVDGVGKTTIAVNTAISLSQLSKEKVCLIDADLQFGDVCRFLYVNPEKTIADFAGQDIESSYSLDPYIIKWNDTVDLFAAPKEPGQSQLITPVLMNAAIKELACKYSYIVIDTAIGFSEVTLDILELSNLILFVNVLDSISCVKNLRLGMDTFKGLGYTQEKVQLILNRYRAKTAVGIEEVEKAINSRFVAEIDNDFASVSGAIQARQPMVLYRPERNVSKDIFELAQFIMDDQFKKYLDKPSSIKDRFSKWLKG